MSAAEQPQDGGAVWVRTGPTADGVYRVTLETTEDRAEVLDRDTALAHAAAVLAAAQRAEYDAAILRQLTEELGRLHGPDEARKLTAEVIAHDIRPDRPALPAPAGGLTLTPGVSASTGGPFLLISIDGKTAGQWSTAAARDHALAVIEAIEAADLDAGYYRALTAVIGLDTTTARNVVEALQQHRGDDPQ